MSAGRVTASVLDGFDDPLLGPEGWRDALHTGDSDLVFLTWGWQRAWWDSFGRGDLMLIAVRRDNRLVALAPLFADAGMVFFVGSGGSDYLDFVGDVGDPEILAVLLQAARDRTAGFLGFRLYHVPTRSRTGERLQEAAGRLGLVCVDEGSLAAPALAMPLGPDPVGGAAWKKSLLRHERYFRARGLLDVRHLRDGEAIRPHLEEFFQQHRARWGDTPYPSLFNDPMQRAFYRRLTELSAHGAWLRFTRLDWNGVAIAFHFGFCYKDVYMWYKPSFAMELARRSPGEVLIRQLLMAAAEEGARTFDFGLGDEAFKRRFATHVHEVRTWGLYPPEALGPKSQKGNAP